MLNELFRLTEVMSSETPESYTTQTSNSISNIQAELSRYTEDASLKSLQH